MMYKVRITDIKKKFTTTKTVIINLSYKKK